MPELTRDAAHFLPADYHPNQARTADPASTYWTPRRVETSTLFQYAVYKEARAMLRRTSGARVLDIGCGTARKAAELVIPYCAHYVGLDQESAIAYCRSTILAGNAEFRAASLDHLSPLQGPAFDLVVCADVIEHLEDPFTVMAAARHAIRDGGRLLLSTPERDVLHGSAARRPENPDHVREWNRRELRDYLASMGLTVLHMHLAPQFRFTLSRAGIRLARGALRHPRAYWGCQVALCAAG
jgi:SAM-dependent methyltransferase